MNKIKVLQFAIIVLIILNIGLVCFIFFSKGNGERMPREIVIEKLHFNKNQIVKYDRTIKNHQKNIRKLDDSIRKTKNNLYLLLNSENNIELKKDSLIQNLSSFQQQIEATHFNHFLEIKSICNQEQLADYEELTTELSKIFSNRKKPKHE